MSAWECIQTPHLPGCDAKGEGTPSAVDKAAAKHVKDHGHSTQTWTTDRTTLGWERP